MTLQQIAYWAPILPVLSRGVLVARFSTHMKELLPEEALEREQQRSLILALAGFSFTGLLGLAVVDSALEKGFQISLFYLLTSFLTFMWSLNLQGYKVRRWHSSIAVGLIEIGSLSLLLSVISILWLPAFDQGFSAALSAFAFFVWGLDHFLRLRFEYKYLRAKERNKS